MVFKFYVEELVYSGVKVYKYKFGFIYFKMIICDKEVVMIGLSNLDFRSLYMYLENNLWLNDIKIIFNMVNYYEYIFKESECIIIKDFIKRNIIYRVV